MKALSDIPINSRPTKIACRVCDCPYVLPNSRTCAQCGATGKQRTGGRTSKAEREFVAAFTPNKYGEYA